MNTHMVFLFLDATNKTHEYTALLTFKYYQMSAVKVQEEKGMSHTHTLTHLFL